MLTFYQLKIDRGEIEEKKIKAFVMSVNSMRLLRNVASCYILYTRNLVPFFFPVLFLMYEVQ